MGDGVVMNRFTRTSTPPSRVAENSIRCPAFRRLVEQPSYDGEETKVGHVVGFVDHGDLDAAEVDVAALQVVGEPAGAGNHDVDTGAEGVDLWPGRRLHRRR